jgi:3-phosphoinositide dependent protein kinase-1
VFTLAIFLFEDTHRLYFVITYAKNGDLLRFIDRMAQRDVDCTQFYAAELVAALEFLHERNIIHRDLKPENILLNEKMHIMITDFGSAKLLPADPDGGSGSNYPGCSTGDEPVPCKRGSFVGTAQYVSPEVLSGGVTSYASDLWAFGCVLYQMVTGMPPFQSQSEFLIFQKIQKLEYTFYEGFDEHAKELIKSLLVIVPEGRIGAKDETR